MKRVQALVIGVGRFGTALAQTLYDLGHEVVAVDRDENAVEDIMNQVTHAAILDATEEQALQRLGINTFDYVIVAIGGDFEANVLATVAAKSCGARHVISKANSQLAARVLASVGADEVIRPEHDMGVRLAKQLASPRVVDAFDLGEGHRVVELEVGDKLSGTLKELRLTNRFGIQVIAVHRGSSLKVSPGADFALATGDRAVVIGSNEALEKFEHYLNG